MPSATQISPFSDYEHRWSKAIGSQKHGYNPNIPISPLANHPDIQSPGLEVISDENHNKEVVPQESQDRYYGDGSAKRNGTVHIGETDSQPPRRRRNDCGLPFTVFCLLLGLIIVVAVALGIGLGVGLSTHHPSLPGSVHNSHYSFSGAFNGSGIALASQSFGTGGYGVINLYYQHWNGQIRKMQLMQDGTWQGGDTTNIIATDAKNATPISAVTYAMDQKATWHIFYIDRNNIVRQKVSDNTTNQWRDGPIADLNLQAMDADAVGLQACWYGNFYGTATYTHSPIPGTGSNTTSQDAVIGMHLWYGSDPQTVKEVTWTYNTTKWVAQDTFTANGNAGIGCYSWSPGSVSYTMMVDLDNEVFVAWKDLNMTTPATPQHPVNQWVNTSIVIPDVMPNTSLGYTNFLYTQIQDRSIAGYNISFNAENSTIMSAQSFTIPDKPLPGSHFSVSVLPNASGGDSLVVFDQRDGDDITVNTRDYNNGQWLYNTLPVPAI